VNRGKHMPLHVTYSLILEKAVKIWPAAA